MSEAHRFRVTVAAVVPHDGRYLFVEERVAGREVLNQPAGHLEPGESLEAAVVRETLEETGWHIAPRALVGVYLWRVAGRPQSFLRVCFLAAAEVHDPYRPLDPEVLAASWLTPAEAEIRTPRSPLVMRALQDHQAGRRYPLDVLQTLSV